jgi:hypothetical protein
MTTTQALNADGSVFYANINADSSVRITISEAYTLAQSLRSTAATLRDIADKVPGAIDSADRLDERAVGIERILNADKLRQFQRATGQTI